MMKKMVLALLLSAGSVYGQDSSHYYYAEFDSAFMAENGYVLYGNERDYDVNGFESLAILWNGSFHYLEGSYHEFSSFVNYAYSVAIIRDTLAISDKAVRVSLIFPEDDRWRQAIHTEYKDEDSQSFFLFREIE